VQVNPLVERIRAICLALPDVTEKPSHGTPSFFVNKQFVMLWPEGHHDRHFPHLWCAAAEGGQQELVAEAPQRYFRPPYVGSRGWVGVRLDGIVDWDEIHDVCCEAYRAVAPKSSLAKLDAPSVDAR
jgi:hypothetical protein